MTAIKSEAMKKRILESLGREDEPQEVKSEVQTIAWPDEPMPVRTDTTGTLKKFSEVFWEPVSVLDFDVRVWDDGASPETIEYIWPKEEAEMFVLALENDWKPVVTGPSGCGKTELARQVAAVTGRPFELFSFNADLEPYMIIGERILEDGATVFKEGPLPKAMQTHALACFDEYSRASAAMNLSLQRFTDVGELFMTGRLGDGDEGLDHEQSDVVLSSPDFNLCVADNTLGLGDDMDKYAAANVQDVSTLNRWEVNIHLDYLDPHHEEQYLLAQQPGMPQEVAEKIAKVSELFHTGFKQGELAVPFSMRNLKVVARLTMQLKDPVKALEWNYVNSLDDESKAAARELIRTVFGL